MRKRERCRAFPEIVDPRILSSLFQIPIRSETHERI